MGEIKKDCEYHLYFDGDRRIPSVTEILETLEVPTTAFFLQRRASTIVSGAASFMPQLNRLSGARFNPENPRTLSPFSPFIRAFEDFLSEKKFHPRNSEIVLYVEDWGIAGTMDLDGAFEGDSFWTEIEIKTGKAPKWAKVQAAAYRAMLNHTQPYIG